MIQNRVSFLVFIALVAWLVFGTACKDDLAIDRTSAVDLRTSADTIFFDTVFTSPNAGTPLSVNKQFVIVNPLKNAIEVSVSLAGIRSGLFRLNVDGIVGPDVRNLTLLPGDSVFAFVELHVDPNNDPMSLPLIVRDSIRIESNGKVKHVQLVAWGQDAHYMMRDTLCNTVLDDPLKPYVVYGYLYVPENCVLTIEKGVKMHFAPRSWLFVEGTLIINGTKEDPVYFEGDRLEPDFEEIAGQWGGIWLAYPSKDNSITHARIKNATVGVYCDSISSNGAYNVAIRNTHVRNMLFDGLSGKGSSIQAQNSIFENCGRFSFLGLYGGNYKLQHCDFVTYNFDFARRDPTFVLNNIQRDEAGAEIGSFPIRAQVQNNIIYGSLDNELALDFNSNKVDEFMLQNNLIKTELEGLDVAGLNNLLNQDPRFKNPALHKFQLDTLSPAIDLGRTLSPIISTDFDENPRNAKPDAGAFERID
jgi:hypothetical protein